MLEKKSLNLLRTRKTRFLTTVATHYTVHKEEKNAKPTKWKRMEEGEEKYVAKDQE